MSKRNVLDGLSVGDIVETRRTLRVTGVRDYAVSFADVQSDRSHFIIRGDDAGSLRIDMVKKAAPPKPKAGDVLTGQELRNHWWKRGTTLRYTADDDGRTIIAVLQSDGRWHATDHYSDGAWDWEFDSMGGELTSPKFELLHVA